GILITTIASKGELQNWPDLLPKLCSLLDSEDYNTCEGAFGALQKICEDSAEILDSDVLDQPLNIMIPKFLQFFKHSSPKISVQLIEIPRGSRVKTCAPPMSWVKYPLAFLGPSPSWDFRSSDHSGLDWGSRGRVWSIASSVPVIGGPCRGWDTGPEAWGVRSRALPHQSKAQPAPSLTHAPKILIPVLVNGMKYSEIDIILLKGDVEEDEAIPDSEQDIRPRFHRSRTVAQPHEDHIEDDDDDDDDDNDNDLDDDDTISDWNL
ncbi:TNPO1 protein, partial [Hippolais icterina]|nr:TNPO1 protein [Hippolais icterina]